jgi:hypothetical protein
MPLKIFFGFFALSFSFLVLFVSIFRSASIKYAFSPVSASSFSRKIDIPFDYNISYPGSIMPDNILWNIKVIRDRVWLTLTSNPVRRAELLLMFADKRLISSYELFYRKEPDLAVAVLTRAEKYLEQAAMEERLAYKQGFDTCGVLFKLENSTIIHRKVVEEVMKTAPEEARPIISRACDYPKRMYTEVHPLLMACGMVPPKNPYLQN